MFTNFLHEKSSITFVEIIQDMVRATVQIEIVNSNSEDVIIFIFDKQNEDFGKLLKIVSQLPDSITFFSIRVMHNNQQELQLLSEKLAQKANLSSLIDCYASHGC